jgi:hypothetical protein
LDHNIYEHAFTPFDYRVFSRWFFASTIKVYGVYFGTDKIGHFTDMGIAYYCTWQQARANGATEEQAMAAAVRLGTQGPGSEDGWLGLMANGDYANGDLAANYLGFLFYRNIAEPTFVKGTLRAPMVVRDGVYWRIADHIRRDSDFFAIFVSEHLDEALNPGFFDESMRPGLREAVKDRAQAILWRYRDEHGSIRSRQYFQRKIAELSTYWGADYGHRGTPSDLVSIPNCCFGAGNENLLAQKRGGTTDPTPDPSSVGLISDQQLPQLASSQLGKDEADCPPLAASRVNPAPLVTLRVQNLLTREPTSGTPDRDEFGRTALHDAASVGATDKLQSLLANGADPNLPDDYGTTALHLACRNGHGAAARLLLSKGARVNATNLAGSTPLHEAASCGDTDLVLLLLEHGAPADVRDRRGRLPADIAGARGYSQIVAALRNAGSAPATHISSNHEAIASSK